MRQEALAGLKERELEVGPGALFRELLANPQDGLVKLYLIFRVLNYRRGHRGLFEQGDYLPLEATGARGRHLCAFARRAGGETVVVAAPRLVATLAPEPGGAPLGDAAWLDSFLPLPDGAGGRFCNVITDQPVEAVERGGVWGVPLAALFAEAPLALLERRD